MTASALDIARLRASYEAGDITPRDMIAEVLARIAALNDDAIWISRRPDADLLAEAEQLGNRFADRAEFPLYGIPFAVKDNIDVAGLPTTAACHAYEYRPPDSAPVVERLIAAGAIVIGKTNLDQFATGLVGVRSPYGVPRNTFDPAMVPGGSSSGSAVAVAAGLVSFALGTDTAGSGRVPAAFNNLVGLKPTRGLLSNRGMVPACRSLDCISIFALTVRDAVTVLDVAQGFDELDAYSRLQPAGFRAALRSAPAAFTFAVPHQAQLEFFGDVEAQTLFAEAVSRAEALGGTRVEIDFAPWIEVASLLYGLWTAERTAAIGPLLAVEPDVLHPVTRRIIEAGLAPKAVETFEAQYRLQELTQAIRPVWDSVDCLLVPTTGTAFSLAELAAEPIARNSDLGYYTNFTNLLDLAAIAVPGGFKASGFPVGVTLIGPAWHDAKLAALGHAMHQAMGGPLGATGQPQPPSPVPSAAIATYPAVDLAVFGAHLSGGALNPQLRSMGGRFVRRCHTAARYRMVALPGEILRPGLIDAGDEGRSIQGEIWSLPATSLAAFLATIARPLGLGTVQLTGDESCLGFICEGGALVAGATDVSHFGFWPAYLQSLAG
ncbi:allophanate hydrolase [Acidisoma sp.]|uniref:allophanate hydrolase n=1 Tax=Acidisoma sp. TaxID=1872115 RepID=UPI003AFFE6E0